MPIAVAVAALARSARRTAGALVAPTFLIPLPPSLNNSRRSPPQAELIDSEFAEERALQRAIDLVSAAGGVEAARALAREEADKALAALATLPASRARRSLELMVDYVLDRIY